MSYRSTPHATTGVAPAQLLFNRSINDELPSNDNSRQIHSNVQKIDSVKKNAIKSHADLTNAAQKHSFRNGDTALTANLSTHRNKFQSRWNHHPTTIIQVKGNSILLKQNDFLHNVIHVKPYNKNSEKSVNPSLSSQQEIDIDVDVAPLYPQQSMVLPDNNNDYSQFHLSPGGATC